MVKCAIYCRISSDKAGEALGVARQEADCRALAARLGWTVAVVYVDNDVSAYSGKPRPEYRKLLASVAAGEVGAVITYAPDRLYRRTRDLAEFIDIVTTAGCQVQTVAGGEVDLTTATGRMQARVVGAFAEFRSDQQGELIRRKLAERRFEGKPHGGQRPFGWEPDRMTIRESEAETIRWGVAQTLAGVPLRTQFRDLNARGVTNSRGGAWTHSTYRGVLMTARHAGLMRDGDTASWPAIITPQQHWAVVRLLSAEKRVTTPGRGGKLSLLSGLAVCGVCGGPLRASKSESRGYDPYLIYRCYPGGHVQCHRGQLDGLVLAVVAERFRRPDAAGLMDTDKDESIRAARVAAEQRAVTLRLQIDQAAADHATSGLPFSTLAAYVAPLREQLAAAERASERPRDRSAVLGDVLDAPDPGAAFLDQSVDRQRAVIDLLLSITLDRGRPGRFDPERAKIEWKS